MKKATSSAQKSITECFSLRQLTYFDKQPTCFMRASNFFYTEPQKCVPKGQALINDFYCFVKDILKFNRLFRFYPHKAQKNMTDCQYNLVPLPQFASGASSVTHLCFCTNSATRQHSGKRGLSIYHSENSFDIMNPRKGPGPPQKYAECENHCHRPTRWWACGRRGHAT